MLFSLLASYTAPRLQCPVRSPPANPVARVGGDVGARHPGPKPRATHADAAAHPHPGDGSRQGTYSVRPLRVFTAWHSITSPVFNEVLLPRHILRGCAPLGRCRRSSPAASHPKLLQVLGRPRALSYECAVGSLPPCQGRHNKNCHSKFARHLAKCIERFNVLLGTGAVGHARVVSRQTVWCACALRVPQSRGRAPRCRKKKWPTRWRGKRRAHRTRAGLDS